MDAVEYEEFYKSSFNAYDKLEAHEHFSLEGQVGFSGIQWGGMQWDRMGWNSVGSSEVECNAIGWGPLPSPTAPPSMDGLSASQLP